VRAVDTTGNVGNADSKDFTVDTVAPVTSITDVQVTGTTATVSFSSSATDVARFECKLDGGTFATCTSPKTLSGLSQGTHTIRVRAVDTTGNVGDADSKDFTVDTVAPTTAITNVQVTGTTATVSFSSSATDVAHFECKLDDGDFATCTSPKTLSGLSQGVHVIAVRAVDQTGNVGDPDQKTYTVDTGAPVVAIGTVQVTGVRASVPFSSPATDIDRFECKLDDGSYETCTSPIELADLAQGAHTIRVRAVDTTGNVGDADSKDFTVDTVAPAASITDVQVSGTAASVKFSSSAIDVERFECKLDAGTFATCTSPIGLSGLAGGQHTISVRAIDHAGNVGAAIDKTFTVDPPPSSGDGGATGGSTPAPVADTKAPKVTLASKSLKVSKSGTVGLKLGCPTGETRCAVTVRLRLGNTTVASRSATIAGGSTATLKLKLNRAARKRLAKTSRLKLKALIAATDAAGNRSTATIALTLRR
jgi:hypothetical protein